MTRLSIFFVLWVALAACVPDSKTTSPSQGAAMINNLKKLSETRCGPHVVKTFGATTLGVAELAVAGSEPHFVMQMEAIDGQGLSNIEYKVFDLRYYGKGEALRTDRNGNMTRFGPEPGGVSGPGPTADVWQDAPLSSDRTFAILEQFNLAAFFPGFTFTPAQYSYRAKPVGTVRLEDGTVCEFPIAPYRFVVTP